MHEANPMLQRVHSSPLHSDLIKHSYKHAHTYILTWGAHTRIYGIYGISHTRMGRYIRIRGRTVLMHSSLVAFKLQLAVCIDGIFKFLCTTVGKQYCKLPLGMQRPIVTNELSKGRCATCKGRMSVILCGYMHAYNVAS